MKRGISLIILLLCALCLQAQSDLTWIRTKEGRMVAVPKRAVFGGPGVYFRLFARRLRSLTYSGGRGGVVFFFGGFLFFVFLVVGGWRGGEKKKKEGRIKI